MTTVSADLRKNRTLIQKEDKAQLIAYKSSPKAKEKYVTSIQVQTLPACKVGFSKFKHRAIMFSLKYTLGLVDQLNDNTLYYKNYKGKFYTKIYDPTKEINEAMAEYFPANRQTNR